MRYPAEYAGGVGGRGPAGDRGWGRSPKERVGEVTEWKIPGGVWREEVPGQPRGASREFLALRAV